MTTNPVTFRSKISSSYLSESSELSGASSARTAFNNPDALCAGSMRTGCISDNIRVPPIGRAEDGAIDSDKYMHELKQHLEKKDEKPNLRLFGIS